MHQAYSQSGAASVKISGEAAGQKWENITVVRVTTLDTVSHGRSQEFAQESKKGVWRTRGQSPVRVLSWRQI